MAVVGGGQAGLSMSYCLRERGIAHLVIEAGRVGREWRERRWDTFCLVTPNWQCKLPGFPYAGPDPDGFMNRAEIVRYLEDYAASFDPPLVEGVSVTRLRRLPDGPFELSTTVGVLTADQVVVATGPYHAPSIPRMAGRLPTAVTQLHSSRYRNPDQLPTGAVLVVGTGQSGCQIAEDLHLAGRQVHLAVGGAPRIARFYRGRDCVAWLNDMGHYAKSIDAFTDADAVRLRANHYVNGRDGGRDIDLRGFAVDGMRLYGRLTGIDGAGLTFADDLKANLDRADSVAEGIKDAIDAYIAAHDVDAPVEARCPPAWEPGSQRHRLDLEAAAITSVIWSTGFVQDHSWIEVPVFGSRGRPMHRRGVTGTSGLYFLGLPWQSRWGSGRLEGVGRDARFLAVQIDASRRLARRVRDGTLAEPDDQQERDAMFGRLNRRRDQQVGLPERIGVAPRLEPQPDRTASMPANLHNLEWQSLHEIPHPSLPEGSSIYGNTKVFPEYQAHHGESYFTLVHGIAHESSVSFVAVLQATRALRKGFETAIFFYGPGSLNCLATRGFPTTGNSAFPGEHNINNQLKTFIAEGGKVYCCRFGLSLHGAREEDLIEGVIPTHPLDVQDAVIHYARKGAIINSTYQL